MQKFYNIYSRFKAKYGRYTDILMEIAEHYMAFIKYAESLRKNIYINNSVESINSLIENLLIKSGGTLTLSKF